MITAGELRHRIQIEKATETQNSLGESVTVFGPYLKMWAKVTPLSGTELFRARQVQSDVTHEVRLRWVKELTPAFRILYGTRVLEIISVVDVEERHFETLCLCKEHVTNG